MADKQVVLITGASTGFGRESAILFAKRGYIVYGTSRRELSFPEYKMLVLDVRSDESVRRCVAAVLAAEGRIDVLVNNAGYLNHGFLEEMPLDEVRSIFETNFFGYIRMINAVLPGMRQRRTGRIINIGSLGGLVSAPGHGYYYATKFALEGYSEALSYEVRSLGIKVTLIEPGFYKTNLHAAMVRVPSSIPDYDGLREPVFSVLDRADARGADPAPVARLVADVAEKKSPRLRYRLGPGAWWIPLLRCFLPQKVFAWGTRKFFHLPR